MALTVGAIATVGSDAQLIDLWLSGKSPNTREAYRRDIDYFLQFIEGKALQQVTLNDFQAYRQAIAALGWAESTVARRLNAVKSLLTYGNKIGVLAVNCALPEKVAKGKDTLSQRILPESAVLRMLHGFQGSERDRTILRFLYATGCRASEVTALTWADATEQDEGTARLTIHGKSNKTRVILLSAETWAMVKALRQGAPLDAPIFRSRNGRSLSRYQLHRIVKAAAAQAGIEQNVSAHWLRHAHASHSLKRGASINLVKESLGHSRLDTTGIYLHADPSDSSGLYLGI